MCESFFATVECEFIDRNHLTTRALAKTGLFWFIEGWYNNPSPALRLGLTLPEQFERVTDKSTAIHRASTSCESPLEPPRYLCAEFQPHSDDYYELLEPVHENGSASSDLMLRELERFGGRIVEPRLGDRLDPSEHEVIEAVGERLLRAALVGREISRLRSSRVVDFGWEPGA
jgi:hypothetical protein